MGKARNVRTLLKSEENENNIFFLRNCLNLLSEKA
jgi:hypothetical protein